MIRVVAKNFVKADKIEEFKNYVKELAVDSRKEEGCIAYELYEDVSNPTILTFLEEWTSQEALEIHMKTKHFVTLFPALQALAVKEGEVSIYKLLI